MGCYYAGEYYDEGATRCQAGWEKECRGEKWVATGFQCDEKSYVPKKGKKAEEKPTD